MLGLRCRRFSGRLDELYKTIDLELGALLASSHKYSPARALAAEALEGSPLDWPLLSARLEHLLTHYFEGQATSGFRLLRCLEDQGDSPEMGGYGGVGHYYWILASDGEKLTWVSDHDYLVHRAPICEFDVPEGCILPSCPPPVPDWDVEPADLLAKKPDFG